jgi:hypothetical protein
VFDAGDSPSTYDVSPGPASASLLAQADPATLSTYDLVDAIKSWDRLASWAQANQAKMLAEFAYRREPSGLYDEGFDRCEQVSRYVVDEISCALSLTRRGAENRLSTALQLSESLPGTLAAWKRGTLDWSKVNMIVDRTVVLDEAGRHRFEESVLPRTIGQTTGQLRRMVDRAVIAVDPAAADARHERERLARDVTIRPADDGMSVLQAYLCAEEAAAAHRVLQQFADDRATDDPRSAGQCRADAFMRLLTGAQSTGPSTPVNQLGRPLVHVVVSADTLSGRSGSPAELVGHGPISTELARRLAADGTWQRILADRATGDVVDIGRRHYRPPAALTDYIRARDQVCTFPTCQQPANDCDLDHSTAYDDGGETSADNLTAKCRRHHLLKHHAGWTTIQQPDDTVTWISPTGHRYENSPPRLVHEEPLPPATATAPPLRTADDPPPF